MALIKLFAALTAFVVQIIRFRYACVRLKTKRRLLRTLMEMSTLTPTQIMKKLSTKDPKKTLMLCKGMISAPEPCYSILDSTKRVVFSAVFGPKKNFTTLNQRMLNYKEASYMNLSDSDTTIGIFESHWSKYCPREWTEIRGDDSFLGILQSGFQRMFYRKMDSNFSGVDYKTFATDPIREYFIADGSQAVIFGEFSRQSEGIACFSPKFVSTSKERIISVLQDTNYMRQAWLIISGIFVVITGYIAVEEAWKQWKIWNDKRRRDIDGLKRIRVRSRVCNRCRVNLSCMLNKECQHMYLCHECWRQQDEEKCEECRRSVNKVIEMYAC